MTKPDGSPSITWEEVKEMYRILHEKGNPPPLIMLGGPRTDGLKAGVYELQVDNTYVYYTFDEWDTP